MFRSTVIFPKLDSESSANLFIFRPKDFSIRMKTIFRNGCSRIVALCLCFGGIALPARAVTILADNTGNPTSGSDAVSGDVLLAADFSTDSSAWTLASATLVLQMSSTGTAALDLYSDNSGIPGTLIGALSSPATYSSSPAATTFNASGIALAANTSYWLVLSAASGSFDWSWTADNTGSGSGYLGDSAYFDGSYWYQTAGIYPYQVSIAADPAAAAATPDPSSISLLMAVAPLSFFARRKISVRRLISRGDAQ
jgi:hypothetical protein